MTEWFYAQDGQRNGPVSFETLQALARNGQLDPVSDLVWKASMSDWAPSGQIAGLFNAPVSVNVNASNPYAAPQSYWSDPASAQTSALPEIQPGSEQIDPMVCFNRAIDIVKRQFPTILIVGVVYFGCIMGMSFLTQIIQMAAAALSGGGDQASSEPGALMIVVVVMIQIITQVLSIFLQLGMARVGLNLVSGKEVAVGMLFGEGSKLLRTIGASILFGIAMVIGILLLVVPGIYIALRYGQFLTAIVDRDLGIFEAFEYSSSITTNNLMNLFLLAILSILAVLIGLIPCGLGLIFLGPVVWLAALVAYRWMQYGQRATQDHSGTERPMLSGV